MTGENVTLTKEAYQTLKELSDLSLRAAHDPKTRKKFVGIVKELDPTKRFADVEIDDIRDDVRKEFEKRDADKAKAEALARLESQKSNLKSRYDDTAIGEIEKTMEKLGISDYDVGARIYASETKPANPTYIENDHKWTMPNIDPKDYGNLKQIGRQRAMQAIDDIRNKRAS